MTPLEYSVALKRLASLWDRSTEGLSDAEIKEMGELDKKILDYEAEHEN